VSETRIAPLGEKSAYITNYTKELLFPIPRQQKRDEIGVPKQLPFKGFDTWNAYEVSWLNPKGKPVVVIVQFDVSCLSENIIESKSFKLYLNSFNKTKFSSIDEVKAVLERDISEGVKGKVTVTMFKLADLDGVRIETFEGQCLDEEDISCDIYTIHPDYLVCDSQEIVDETYFSDLLKSNCLVTGQPDWGSIQIKYTGLKIDKSGLLKYIISFRDHNEFHEQCVERIFMDIMTRCKPLSLRVEARYTRRGGLDINPIRSTEDITPAKNIRMARQ
jgi:7-cyano-7-deazaguanine reductase